MTKSILPLITAMMLYGCAAGGLNTETESLPAPEWLLIPPHEEGFFYGIGGDSDLDVAKHKSIVDIGMQFSSRVVSALVAGTSIDEGDSVESVISLNEQITDQAVNGAKFCDQYRDEKGMYWVLSRVNTNCLLDVSESLILSYSLELEQEAGIQANALAGVLGTVEKTTNKPLYTLPKATSYERYGTFTPPIRTISVDGQSDDWAGIWEYYRDETDDFKPVPDGTKLCDIQTVHFAVDRDFIYLMVRTLDNPINKRDFFYAFHWETPDGVFYIDIYAPYEGSNTIDSWTRKGHDVEPRTVTSAISAAMELKTGEVLEMAIPMEAFLELEEMQPESKFLILVRTKRPLNDLDDMVRYGFTIPVEELGLEP